jgi:hypothetical protein
MILGIDFDNTIVCYDRTFYRHALAQAIIPPSIGQTKNQIRDYLRQVDREDEWTLLQGLVYGKCMQEVEPFPGVTAFFRECHQLGIPVFIISHKTRYPYKGMKHDLHTAAVDWIKKQALFKNYNDIPNKVFFELTKEEKLERIRKQKCTHFIDDLPEFLSEPAFPSGVYQILFDPHELYPNTRVNVRVHSWSVLLNWLSEQRDS